MKKALKVISTRETEEKPEEFELLISKNRKLEATRESAAMARLRFHCILLGAGLTGTGLCLWAMLDTHDSKTQIQELGLHKVANSLDNILSLLAIPAIMFTGILSAYALQQLYKLYKEVSDPENFTRTRR